MFRSFQFLLNFSTFQSFRAVNHYPIIIRAVIQSFRSWQLRLSLHQFIVYSTIVSLLLSEELDKSEWNSNDHDRTGVAVRDQLLSAFRIF